MHIIIISCVQWLRFESVDPKKRKPKEFNGMPETNDEGISTNFIDLLVEQNPLNLSFDFPLPSFPEKKMKQQDRQGGDKVVVGQKDRRERG